MHNYERDIRNKIWLGAALMVGTLFLMVKAMTISDMFIFLLIALCGFLLWFSAMAEVF